MLKSWMLHVDYQQFLSHAVDSFNESQLKRFSSFSNSIAKLSSLNLDPLADFLAPHYSSFGRPAIHQPEIFRSIILMLDQNYTRLTKWVKQLQSDSLFAVLIGCHPDDLPPLGSYYDFINRLWLCDNSMDRDKAKQLFKYPKDSKPKGKKPGKNKKLPNKHPEIVRKTKDFFMSGRSFNARFERLLQELFSLMLLFLLLILVSLPMMI